MMLKIVSNAEADDLQTNICVTLKLAARRGINTCQVNFSISLQLCIYISFKNMSMQKLSQMNINWDDPIHGKIEHRLKTLVQVLI